MSKETETPEDVNVKTRYRPFKRCFKNLPYRNIKSVFTLTTLTHSRDQSFVSSRGKKKASNSRGGARRVRYASVKGFCHLNSNGYLP